MAHIDDVTDTIDTYLSAWNERDPERRAQLIRRAWAPDGRLIDPPLSGDGHDGISEVAGAMHEHYRGHDFRRVSAVDEHHDHLRFAWELVAPDGAVTLRGIDVGELAADGRLLRVTGFFGELTPWRGA
ncbi:MAG TPA: nuclear transport factor 2 family protein [Solirubrobacteraceae bacterium]|nr:nuclear transport factor 2 family protein [Solirubrobacteraceae bacterium]